MEQDHTLPCRDYRSLQTTVVEASGFSSSAVKGRKPPELFTAPWRPRGYCLTHAMHCYDVCAVEAPPEVQVLLGQA